MRTITSALLCLLTCTQLLRGEGITIDWDRARELHRRASSGETLSEEDQKYYAEAKKQFQARQQPEAPASSDGFDWKRAMEIHQRKERGESISSEDQKILEEAMRRHNERPQRENKRGSTEGNESFVPSEAAKGLVPLTELSGKYKQWDGGLYGSGSNEVPPAQQALATKALAQIQPLDADGKPSPQGKIVLMSIGMSNTTQEFSTFVRLANGDASKAANVIVVDAAQGGKAARQWAGADLPPWDVASERLQQADVSAKQVQVLWIKQANISPSGTSEAEVTSLQDDLQTIVTLTKIKYPNVRLAFLSSRIYAGYAQTRLNPEPYAFEGAFAVRGLIQKQIAGDASLANDAAPVLLWGPYLWAAGSKARTSDGLLWNPQDFRQDGTHPSEDGAHKVAQQLLTFFTTNPNAKPWFTRK